MMNRIEILKKSLAKKEAELQRRFDEHFATVKQANGQPLNDKRNGQATLNKWEKQNEGIRTAQAEVEKTKRAIEYEEGKIKEIEHVKGFLPEAILNLLQSGELVQWAKYPCTFFVPGVEKARIVWDPKKKIVAHKYAHEITDQEQRTKFARLYNGLFKTLNQK